MTGTRTPADDPSTTQPCVVSFALFTYNQAAFVREAVRGALAQAYAPMEIVISDDASTDGTFAAIEDEVSRYAGPNRVVLNRNEANLGLAAHVNRVLAMCRGRLIVMAAGDDISHPDRTGKMVDLWRASGGSAKSIWSACLEIDLAGREIGPRMIAAFDPSRHGIEDAAKLNIGAHGASHAIDRDLVERFGPLRPDVVSEDLAYSFRAMLVGGTCRCDDALVRYRKGGMSDLCDGWTAADWSGPRSLVFKRRALADYRQKIADIERIGDPRHGKLKAICRQRLCETAVFVDLFEKKAHPWALLLRLRPAYGDGWVEKKTVLRFLFPRLYGAYAAVYRRWIMRPR